jgi:Kelch motif.
LFFVWLFFIFCIGGNAGPAFLLTDGSILLNECASGYGTRRWWKLAPDGGGNYVGGIWLRVTDSLNARKYFASAVLADGRFVVAGGEYSDTSGSNKQDESSKCEIYDPVANTWTQIATPGNLAQLGDAACCMLADGRLLIADINSTQTFTLNPSNLLWSLAAINGAKTMNPQEESWVLMADGTVITPECANPPNAEKYDPASDKWVSASALVANIVENASSEIGPGVLLPDGRAFFVGSNGGNTALYTSGGTPTSQGTWAAGPTIPLPPGSRQALGSKDGPGSLEPGGKFLFPAAPVDGQRNNYNSPCSFFECDGKNIARVSDPPNSNCPTYVGRLLVLPTGEILWTREDDSGIYLFQSTDAPQDAWRPVITAAPASITPGTTVNISGTQFNGISQASAYGDDHTPATNYPIVRIRNRKNGRVRYCRTANHSITTQNGTQPSMGVATENTLITTQLVIPGDIELGPSELFVVANGIPSAPVAVNIIPAGRG